MPVASFRAGFAQWRPTMAALQGFQGNQQTNLTRSRSRDSAKLLICERRALGYERICMSYGKLVVDAVSCEPVSAIFPD